MKNKNKTLLVTGSSGLLRIDVCLATACVDENFAISLAVFHYVFTKLALSLSASVDSQGNYKTRYSSFCLL
jgi:hypothetical protein